MPFLLSFTSSPSPQLSNDHALSSMPHVSWQKAKGRLSPDQIKLETCDCSGKENGIAGLKERRRERERAEIEKRRDHQRNQGWNGRVKSDLNPLL